MSIDFKLLASRLLNNSTSLLEEWFPSGKWVGHEYKIGDIHGSPGDSLSINSNTGVWKDFATGDSGSDLISLYALAHHMSQSDAARELDPIAVAEPPKRAKYSKTVAQYRLPPDDEPPPMVHPHYGEPSATWCYRGTSGEVLGYIARYDPPNCKKQIVPWTYSDRGWQMKHFPSPRPLYGLHDLAKNPDKPVMIVEGEKSAVAARMLAKQYTVVSWPGGSQAYPKADFTPLHGHKILCWPDADEPGRECMQIIAHQLAEHCPEVKYIDVPPDTQPGFDAADAVISGWTWQEFSDWAKPHIRVIEPSKHEPPTYDDETPLPSNVPDERTELIEYDWREQLDITKNGVIIANLDNVVRVLEHDPIMIGHIWYDEFQDSIITNWQGPERRWRDSDDVLLQLYIQREVGIKKIGVTTIHDAVLVSAFHNMRNECKEWMLSLKWDGIERLPYMLSDGFGANQNEYTKSVGRCWVTSMVARVLSPGCKVDTVPVFEGGQGAGKSTAMSIIGGKWFTECHESVTTKDFYGVLHGHMLVEIAEMHSFTRSEVERIKGIISCRVDRYRKSYGRNTEDHPRQCVLTCTTNRDDWQRDETGARRFWPVLCLEINHSYLRENRDQLFAEAVSYYQAGRPWWDVPEEAHAEEVKFRQEHDSWQKIIEDWLIGKTTIQMHELLLDCLKIEISKHDIATQRRVGRILRIIGFERSLVRIGIRVERAWRRIAENKSDF